jgi:signal transduction histidine kinase
VEKLTAELRKRPTPELLVAVDELEDDLDKRLTVVENELHAARTAVWERYHRAYDRMTLIGVIVNLVGVIVLGTLVTMFFSRLAWDIGKLKERARAVVTGYRGPELAVTRHDEVGDLMEAVNHMQTELRERDQKLEVVREQHYHREKMAAMGSLASAVAHEINNPIAAIAGVAQAMAAAQKTGRGAESKVVVEGPAMILEQAQRISAISRQVAEFTRPPANTPAMIDVNAVIRSTCKFVQYDRRLRNVELDLALYKELPAVLAIADHVTQVLMNLIINAADALTGVTGRKPTIRIATYRGNDEVVMTVIDNGRGMDSETLARAFEEAFTTKSAGEGRGLGLFLCRSLLERSGGRIDLQSTPGEGTTATVRFPQRPATISIDA